ncbi:hypothetical protein U6A24_21265 [Aquimarina gracilis]|uniref:Natural product n=1 Tax=Aquimarina gracilis TaxID=874422 RepID=A0ABU6A1P0_9FLAO|nr:hypothetical protein [Aquimarina gracilis]MEB3348019.1 hypothetical protein [Aquimarina gracilis]
MKKQIKGKKLELKKFQISKLEMSNVSGGGIVSIIHRITTGNGGGASGVCFTNSWLGCAEEGEGPM